MNELTRLLARRIRATGPLSIAEYMTEALHHPTLGYYARRDPIGRAGDFITAPEVSQIFGELLGLWCADVWERMGRPDPVILAELGPGHGSLMADALRALRVAPHFRRALRLHLVEASAMLRRRQAEKLGGAEPVWHDDLTRLPDGPLILIANEFLDALPIRQFVRGASGWHERRVVLAEDGERLAFAVDSAPSLAPALAPPALQSAPPGSIWEICPAATTMGATPGARLKGQGGVALFIDYGYVANAGGDTLQALKQHRRHDVLADPGDADLTAHVDFAAVAAAAVQAGARAFGPVSQAAFLRALGAKERAAQLRKQATPAQAAAIESGCRRLLDENEMGTLFKALAIVDPKLGVPAGFTEERPPC
ncbi:MAG TPA: SAM-dependent methyltransferase [Stellaceae bacterium]|nr:SAM-dependent methyltransferase [Stellaceae bacterium]